MPDSLTMLFLMVCLLGTVSGPTILTPPQIARRWHCKAEAVRELCERGLLAGFRVGNSHWRITLAAVEQYEHGRAQPQPPLKQSRRRRPSMANVEGPF